MPVEIGVDRRDIDQRRAALLNTGVRIARVAEAEASLSDECLRLHYLSVPPKAALDVVQILKGNEGWHADSTFKPRFEIPFRPREQEVTSGGDRP